MALPAGVGLFPGLHGQLFTGKFFSEEPGARGEVYVLVDDINLRLVRTGRQRVTSLFRIPHSIFKIQMLNIKWRIMNSEVSTVPKKLVTTNF